MKQFLPIVVLVACIAAAPRASAQAVLYVKSDAAGANTGASWADAFTGLDAALGAATPGDQIWVAAGTYKPANAAPNNFFLMESGVELYGGFNGTETSLNQRNYLANTTILDGDIAGDDIAGDFSQKRTDNALHILYVLNGDPEKRSVVDGFRIKGGNTSNDNNGSDLTRRGGGILARAKVTVRNCYFTDNFAQSGAGVAAIEAAGSGLIVDNCIFDGNFANSQSAGVYMRTLTEAEVNRCIFRNNTTNRGCVYPQYSDNVAIDSCLFENNQAGADQFGAAMFTYQSNFVLSNSVIRKNTAPNAAGMYNDGRDGISSFLIDNCVFDSNITSGYGGSGMYNWICDYELKNSTFKNNYAPNTGSAIYNGNSVAHIHDCLFENGQTGETGGPGFGGAIANYSAGSEVTIENCTFRNNMAARSGGAVTNGFTATTMLKNCNFESNGAQYGGAVFCQNDSTALDVEGCTFSGNGAEISGGAINVSAGITCTVNNTLFSGNSSNFGGAIQMSEDSLDLAVLNIDNSIFRDNFCSTQAGALNINNADVQLVNCLFSANINFGTGAGGAISNNGFEGKISNVKAVNCTFANNEAAIGAGIAQFESDSGNAFLRLQNCIFENPVIDNYAIEEGEPDVESLGGNLSSDASLLAYLNGATDVNESSPLFVNASANDFHVPVNSPAIDIGIADGAPATDIEGNPRINEPDAGCYENQEVLGTSVLPKALRLQLSPNPVVDLARLTVENDWRGAVRVEVLNPAQVAVRTWNAEKAGDQWQFEFDVKNLPAGAYFARVRMGEAVYMGTLIR